MKIALRTNMVVMENLPILGGMKHQTNHFFYLHETEKTYPTKREVRKIIDSKSVALDRGYVIVPSRVANKNHSLKLTASLPLKIGRANAPKGNDRIPTIHFQV